MILETKRLRLRPFRKSDASSFYEYAKEKRVADNAGWPAHQNIAESGQIIKDLLMVDGVFALTLKEEDKVIGCIGISLKGDSNLELSDDEGELGYWIGLPFWGNGYVPEAAAEVIRYAFEDLKLNKLWLSYFNNNLQSKRVSDKIGFSYVTSKIDQLWPLTNEIKTIQLSALNNKDWLSLKTKSL